ncbi:MAG TPA: hypothetical protein PK453_21675, partial [Leptospiraceae bacterium]|nr:hypothetical protein [Leptospiraceae bacterium]
KPFYLLLSLLSVSCIRLDPSPFDTSKNPAALIASFLLASGTKAGSGTGTLAASSFITLGSPFWVGVNSSANLLYVTNYNSNTVTFFNAATGAYAF